METVKGFRFLREQEFFKRIEEIDYIIWTDVGNHFRNLAFIGYLMKELGREGISG